MRLSTGTDRGDSASGRGLELGTTGVLMLIAAPMLMDEEAMQRADHDGIDAYRRLRAAAAGFEVVTLPIKVFNTLRMGFQPTMCVGAVLFVAIGVAAFVLVAAVGDLPKLLGGKA